MWRREEGAGQCWWLGAHCLLGKGVNGTDAIIIETAFHILFVPRSSAFIRIFVCINHDIHYLVHLITQNKQQTMLEAKHFAA